MIDFEEFKFNELLDKKISVVLNKRFKIFTFILSDTLKKQSLRFMLTSVYLHGVVSIFYVHTTGRS